MSAMAFERMAVLGPGLLGGSMGLAVRERGVGEVVFWGRSEQKLQVVREAGFEAFADLRKAVEGADFVVLGTPVGVYAQLARQLVAIGGEFLVTDVGSVKVEVHAGAGSLLKAGGIDFVGSHPMAGSEQTGFEVARADLFEGAACFLTNEESVEDGKPTELKDFWTTLGCEVREISAAQHDQLVGRISHLPHLLASLGAQVALRESSLGAFGGGGLRDTTRVAAGDPAMWAGILISNRETVLQELEKSDRELQRVRQLLAEGKDEDLHEWLKEAKKKRDELC